MSGDAFTARIFAWLNQVSSDAAISHSGFRLAFVVSQHINRKSEAAWPTQETLAHAVGVSDRMVRTLSEQLIGRGHLLVEGSGGRQRPNVYRMALKTRNSGSANDAEETRKHVSGNEALNPEAGFRQYEPKPGSFVHETRKFSALNPEAQFRQNHLNEPSEEPSESISSENGDLIGGKKGSARKSTKRGRLRAIEDQFERWWKAYPRRVAKTAALQAYSRVIKENRCSPGNLLAGAERYAGERAGQEERFTKHPATWLRGGCWADEPASPSAGLTIDQHGNEIATPARRQSYRGGSNLDAAFEGYER